MHSIQNHPGFLASLQKQSDERTSIDLSYELRNLVQGNDMHYIIVVGGDDPRTIPAGFLPFAGAETPIDELGAFNINGNYFVAHVKGHLGPVEDSIDAIMQAEADKFERTLALGGMRRLQPHRVVRSGEKDYTISSLVAKVPDFKNYEPGRVKKNFYRN